MSDIFFTADLHLGHSNIIKFCDRPFESVEDMDKTLIDNWNSVVKHGDTVYHLGDFSFGNRGNYIRRLNGNIVFLKGSHDKDLLFPYIIVIEPPGLFDEYGNQRTITLCHYAMRSWPLSHYASWHLFGHSHGKLEPYGLSFDVGVDSWDFYPLGMTGVENKMSTLEPIVDFRKGKKNG